MQPEPGSTRCASNGRHLPLKAVKAKQHFERLLSDASLRGGVERAARLPRDALHSASAHADFTGNFVHAFTRAQLLLDALFNLLAYARPTQRLTGFYGPL
jgi:hypothetical protein